MTGWIVIRHWDRYQHFHDRDPIWIKDYRSQLSNDAFLNLSFRLRGVLQSLRLAYADSDGQLPRDTQKLSRRCNAKVTVEDIETLNHAGFLDVVDNKPISLARSREKRREEKKPAKPKTTQKTLDQPRANAAAYQPFQPPQFDIDPASLELARQLANG